jgi:hypothetical protein
MLWLGGALAERLNMRFFIQPVLAGADHLK